MKRLLLIILFLPFLASSQSHGLVNWLTIEEAEKKTKENPKPVLVDIYTDWCGWCKKMMMTTFSDPDVANYINQNFYAVRFNAETKDTIVYQGNTYINNQTGPRATHQLAFKFLPQSRSYPSTIFMTGDLQNNMLVPGYLDSKTIAPLLVYYKENLLNEVNINEFMAYFDTTFTPGKAPTLQANIKWYTMQEALKLNQKNPKKIFVHLNDPACVSCKVMDSTTYNHPVIAEYLNKEFYPVRFDVISKDTIDILNQRLVNSGYYHQLAVAAMKNEMNFPAVLFFNEKNELIMNVPQYMTAKFLEPVLVYFKQDMFQQKQFPDFLKDFKGTIK